MLDTVNHSIRVSTTTSTCLPISSLAFSDVSEVECRQSWFSSSNSLMELVSLWWLKSVKCLRISDVWSRNTQLILNMSSSCGFRANPTSWVLVGLKVFGETEIPHEVRYLALDSTEVLVLMSDSLVGLDCNEITSIFVILEHDVGVVMSPTIDRAVYNYNGRLP